MVSSMKCIRFDVCKLGAAVVRAGEDSSSMKCIRFDVCKGIRRARPGRIVTVLNEVHTF